MDNDPSQHQTPIRVVSLTSASHTPGYSIRSIATGPHQQLTHSMIVLRFLGDDVPLCCEVSLSSGSNRVELAELYLGDPSWGLSQYIPCPFSSFSVFLTEMPSAQPHAVSWTPEEDKRLASAVAACESQILLLWFPYLMRVCRWFQNLLEESCFFDAW